MSASLSRIAGYEQEMEEIRHMGGDLTLTHYVMHSLNFAREEDAERAREELAEYAFDDVSVIANDIGGGRTVSASREQVLNARHLERTRSAMERVAIKFGGKYEDWEVGVHMEGWPNCGCDWPKS